MATTPGRAASARTRFNEILRRCAAEELVGGADQRPVNEIRTVPEAHRQAPGRREGAQALRHRVATPYQRVMADPRVRKKVKQQLTRQYKTLNPAQIRRDLTALESLLLKQVRAKHAPTKLPSRRPHLRGHLLMRQRRPVPGHLDVRQQAPCPRKSCERVLRGDAGRRRWRLIWTGASLARACADRRTALASRLAV